MSEYVQKVAQVDNRMQAQHTDALWVAVLIYRASVLHEPLPLLHHVRCHLLMNGSNEQIISFIFIIFLPLFSSTATFNRAN